MSRIVTTNHENAIPPAVRAVDLAGGDQREPPIAKIFGDGGSGEGIFFNKSLPPGIAFP